MSDETIYTITATNMGGGDWTATLDKRGLMLPVAVVSRGGVNAKARAIAGAKAYLPEGETADVR